MVKKRQSLADEIARGMEGRDIGQPTDNGVTDEVTMETQNDTKSYKSNIVSIRFDGGDYERLKEIAQEQGTNGAAPYQESRQGHHKSRRQRRRGAVMFLVTIADTDSKLHIFFLCSLLSVSM